MSTRDEVGLQRLWLPVAAWGGADDPHARDLSVTSCLRPGGSIIDIHKDVGLLKAGSRICSNEKQHFVPRYLAIVFWGSNLRIMSTWGYPGCVSSPLQMGSSMPSSVFVVSPCPPELPPIPLLASGAPAMRFQSFEPGPTYPVTGPCSVQMTGPLQTLARSNGSPAPFDTVLTVTHPHCHPYPRHHLHPRLPNH